jgi:hypothetical protein
MRGLRFEKVFLIVTAIAGLFAVLACADDLVSGDVNVAENVHVTKSGEEKRSLPLGFPGRLVPWSAEGLRVKSLEVFGTAEEHHSSVEHRAEFVWGPDEIAHQDRESPVAMFLIRYDEKTQEQKVVGSSRPTLRVYAGHPNPAICASEQTSPAEKSDGWWATVIVVGRTSPTEPTRLLANHTEFVVFAPTDVENQAGNDGTGAMSVANSEREEVVPESVTGVHATQLREEKKSLPLGFPGRLVSRFAKGLRLKSLQVLGTTGEHHPSVEHRAEFDWGREGIAEQDKESSIAIFLITHDEKTQEQKVVGSCEPTVRACTGQRMPVTIKGTVPLPGEKSDGCWVTVIIVSTSQSEPPRLLANQTKFVFFAPTGEEPLKRTNPSRAVCTPRCPFALVH